MKETAKVGVVGGGTMGNGIAQVFAQAGFRVTLVDVDQRQLDKALATISRNLARGVEKGRLTEEESEATLRRITTSLELNDLAESTIVIEAIIEDAEAKMDLFRRLDSLCAPQTVLASNTSSISITQLAAATKRADKVIGMHFMNPVPVMQLVEVIRGMSTSEETTAFVKALATKLGKIAVEVNDYPGFISNRILMPMINEAIYALMEGVAKRDDIDTVMRLGMNHPMGPLQLADLIGLDVCLHIMEVLYAGFGDSKYRPCPLLRRMVQAGHLGRKSGQGFYKY
ncbi:MAG: 3-hydroxybutyryl-CoA dehydrogenase [Chloroflexi bacterium]|nr:3-hydroxybutyryl-CoA dehydrogenase [Chloroflexota bacterium]MCL5074780.1 3-hydroxybutyryl-CoA dehydrogenase [Chloroflexota bacterium]